MGIQQAASAKLERRADMHFSTMRRVIEAMGGELDIAARFPGRAPVRITSLGEIDALGL